MEDLIKLFSEPKLDIIRFDETDVIATSEQKYKTEKEKKVEVPEFNVFG